MHSACIEVTDTVICQQHCKVCFVWFAQRNLVTRDHHHHPIVSESCQGIAGMALTAPMDLKNRSSPKCRRRRQWKSMPTSGAQKTCRLSHVVCMNHHSCLFSDQCLWVRLAISKNGFVAVLRPWIWCLASFQLMLTFNDLYTFLSVVVTLISYSRGYQGGKTDVSNS